MFGTKLKPEEILFGAAVGIPTSLLAYLRLKYGPTLWKDIKAIQVMKKKQGIMHELEVNNITMVDIFEKQAQNRPQKPFMLFEDRSYTYQEVDQEANKLARFIQHRGAVRIRETVAVFLHNDPAFIWTWLGFNKLGIATAFVNTSLRLESLLHCILVCGAKVVVCGKEPELLDALLAISSDLKSHGIIIWVLGRPGDILPGCVSHLDTRGYSADLLSSDVRQDLTLDDMATHIFTSGTTGLPNACNIPHRKLHAQSLLQLPLGIREDDVMYTPMPLYHTAAFAFAVMGTVRNGATVALAYKFSATSYWDDVRKYGATIIQYIGEMCRYLLAQPKKRKKHSEMGFNRDIDGEYPRKVRYAIGNGMRPDIWREFQRRFNIGHIAELFGASESNFLTINLDGKVGAVGRYTGLLKAWSDSFEIVRCDHVTAEPIRNSNGFCIPVKPEEPGVFLCKITKDTPFNGYKASKEVNEKKIARNVKQVGDEYFNIGDLITYDNDGYLYFYDRAGDTFRWKGENVSTTEVAEIINKFPDILDTNVYGVHVPGNEGKAGMAAIMLKASLKGNSTLTFNLTNFYSYITKHLPLYACPKFLRIVPTMPLTATFKHQKSAFCREGYDLDVISDPMYVMDLKRKTYVSLTARELREVLIGKARL
ncbi:long-chain fatty acid transport protein 2-like [Amphiura filiformis]|uniref:long-chain fatty acid transport protein 2-like n=1 Tax=Amphiura filiformis TaxID=82378 RepID=UPI003B20DA1C